MLTGSHGGEANPTEDIPRYVRLTKAGVLAAGRLITNRYALGNINGALDAMRAGTVAGRCMIRMHDGVGAAHPGRSVP